MSFRLLARILDRSPCIFFQKCTFKNSQAYSTIFSPPNRRRIDRNAFENMKTTLVYVLRCRAGREHGFGNRDDGYVSVKRLLNHPEFQSLDIGRLQKIISTDRKHRFDLEFDPSKGDDSYWIRAKQWNETYWVLKPVLAKDQPGTPVYSTTLEQWKGHIARNGIPRGENDWIEISRSIPTEEYLLDLEDNQQVFIFLNLAKCIKAGVRFFSPTSSAQKWANETPLITKGNEAGYIPPSLFSGVELVTAKKNLVWGDSKPTSLKCWVGYDESDFTADGKRRTFLRAVQGITGFVLPEAFTPEGMPGLRLGDVPGLKDEAVTILRS